MTLDQLAEFVPPIRQSAHPAVQEAQQYVNVCLRQPGVPLPRTDWAWVIRRVDISTLDISEDDRQLLRLYVQCCEMMKPRANAMLDG